jgi:hypothetical protein
MGCCKIQEMRLFTRSFLVFTLFLFFFLGSPGVVSAQKLDHFSGDSTKFIGELNTLFSNLVGNEGKLTHTLMEDFIQKWNQEQYSPSKKQIIYFICNKMLKKRMRTFPDFYNYISAVDVFLKASQPDETFYDWSDILKMLVNSKNSRPFSAFLEASTDLFRDNCIYKSNASEWKILQPNYRFIKDSIPGVSFARSDIVCRSMHDSVTIYATEGIFYPLSDIWAGKGGRVDWRRAGLDPQKVYAELDNYRIQLKFSKVTADSVLFHNSIYLSNPLLGVYSDKILIDVPEEKASYPRFASYDKMVGIKDLFKNIDYLGGFALEGAKVVGTGDNIRQAQLVFKKGEQGFVILRSKAFIIRSDRINSGMASITIYHDNDSIYHPGLQMKYIDDKKELTLTRDERVSTISPWYDSWHKIEIYCEALSWKMNEPKIDFEMMKGPNQTGKAVFESSNYYSQQRYERLQGLDEFNPLYVIKRYLATTKSNEFTLEGLSTYMKKAPDEVESIILTLANKGFLIYDFDNKTATVKQKLFDFEKAKNRQTDYDVLYFNSSVTAKSNGILNLDNFDLKLQGVPKVFLSDSQQVYIYPVNQELILKKDRDFLFSGKIEAGLFDFFAKNCSFEYGKFKLNLPDVDSMSFYVKSRTKDPKTQQYPLVRVKTVITGLSGELLIDDPKNKSGLKRYRSYPIFTSKNDALVNWERKNIADGVYKKDKFFYKVSPFTIKHLGMIPTDSLQFKGSLVSAGIFPEIEQPLVLRPDYSMGIEKVTDEKGLPVYGNKGTFTSKIDLSNSGLRGNGKVTYLNSTSLSDNFLFYPDSMRTLAKSIVHQEVIAGIEYPSVHGDSVNELWLPYKDSLIVYTIRKDLVMYNDRSAFTGSLSLTPNGLTGEGRIKIRDAEMDSRLFQFKHQTFDANIANFRIKAYNLADLSISTRNYQTHFDFEKGRGEFKSNVGISKVEFPFNKYICSMDRFDWLIDNEEISLYNEQSARLASADTMSLPKLIDFDFGGSEFISVHPDQDSLRFFALSARYNLKTNVINCKDVKIIKVADAAIFPDSGNIRILKNAQIEPLKRALIIASTSSKFHNFYNAGVTIQSRKKYSASGNYDYTDRTGKREQIRFEKIVVDSSRQTFAEGFIHDTSNFRLSPEFAFAGDVNIKAGRRDLEFDGGFRLVTDCFRYNDTWVKFKSVIDPANVRIPLTDPVLDLNRTKLDVGVIYSNRENRIYPSVFSKHESFSDSVMISSSGILDYDAGAGEFRVTGRPKAKIQSGRENYLSLNTSSCKMHVEGKINMGLNSGAQKMEAYGNFDYFIIPDSSQLNVSVALNFPFSEAALNKFTTHLGSINLNGISIYNTPYLVAMRNFLEPKDFDKLKSEMEMTGKFKKFPDVMERTLFLAEVHFRWDSVNKSWLSYGPIGIGSIMNRQVNRYVKGIIEFSKKRTGDDFTIYLELTKNDWYFFNYRNNIMQVISSNLEFNDIIMTAMKSNSEQRRVNDISKGYRYVISTDRKKRDFLKKFETGDE